MERRGSGFKKIMMDYQGQPNYNEALKPLFEADSEDFLLTLMGFGEIKNKTIRKLAIKK